MRNALVIGGTGFIGAHLVRRLVSGGVETHVLCFADRAPKPLPGGEPLRAATSQTEDLMSAFAGTRFDAVFHLAAAGVDPRERSPESLLGGNSGLLMRVLDSLHSSPPRMFIYTGSCAEYSDAPSGVLIPESWPTLPGNLYGAAKAAATILGTACARRLQIPFVALRLFHVFGLGESPYRLIPSLVAALTRREKVALTGGRQVRDLLHVDDVVDALITSATAGLPRYEVFNICSGKPVTVREVGLRLAKILDRPAALLDFDALPYRPDEPMWLAGTNRKFIEATGWAPSQLLEEGLESLVRPRAVIHHGL